jgi:ankyrin repeat protein
MLLKREGVKDVTENSLEVIVDKYRGRQAYDLREGKETWCWAVEQGWPNLARHFLRDDKLNTKVSRALSEYLHSHSPKLKIEMAILLVERGADVNAQGGRYGNALQAASVKGRTDIARLLIERGADVNTQGGRYGNALQAASKGGRAEVVQLLLDKGADVNAQGGHYGNALQAASKGGRAEVVRLLLDKGVKVNARGG